MKIEDIITAKNKIDNIYQLVNDLISYHGMEMLDLAYPGHDGKEDANAIAELMMLRLSASSLSKACDILVDKISAIAIIGEAVLEQKGFTLEQSVGGSWRLMKDDELIYDDPACEDLCQDKATAVAFFTEYIKNEN